MSSNLRKFATAATFALFAGAATTATAQSHDGFYAGALIQNDFSVPYLDGALGVFAGYNYGVSSGFVLGAEVEAQYDWATNVVPAGSAFTGLANVRAGYALGNDFLLYGKVGAGVMTGAGFIYNYGIGGDLSVSDKYLLRGEIMRVSGTGMARSRTDFKFGVGYEF